MQSRRHRPLSHIKWLISIYIAIKTISAAFETILQKLSLGLKHNCGKFPFLPKILFHLLTITIIWWRKKSRHCNLIALFYTILWVLQVIKGVLPWNRSQTLWILHVIVNVYRPFHLEKAKKLINQSFSLFMITHNTFSICAS